MQKEIEMNIRHIALTLVCVATQVAFAATPGAAPELRNVTVAAPAIRTDIRAACPAIDAQLQQSLSSAWGRVHQAQTIPVQFHVEGNRVTETRTSITAIDYRPYIRKAMAKLDCAVASGEAQDFKFLLVMVDPDDRSATSTASAFAPDVAHVTSSSNGGNH
jgi:hypothetical protein